MRRCGYCGEINNFNIEEDTGKEYCCFCGTYTGYVELFYYDEDW
jgi:hypothetical protein